MLSVTARRHCCASAPASRTRSSSHSLWPGRTTADRATCIRLAARPLCRILDNRVCGAGCAVAGLDQLPTGRRQQSHPRKTCRKRVCKQRACAALVAITVQRLI